MKTKEIQMFLEEKAVAICQNKLEVLMWFTEENTNRLYEYIMDGVDIDDFMEEVSNRVFELNDIYYILEEEDLLELSSMWNSWYVV